jgi:ABC-type sugar transport system substrate-binding protein
MLKKLLTATIMISLLTLAPAAATAAPTPKPAAAPVPPPEPHPHIRAAIHELREAKRELQTASHDFGGHRAEAVEAVDNAIRQLEKALQSDKK